MKPLPLYVALALLPLCARAQSLPPIPSVPSVPSIPQPPSIPTPPGIPAPISAQSPAAALSKESYDTLKMLHDRKNTLKDFTADIDDSVESRTGDITGKRGTFDFINDPAKGPTFSADFTTATAAGKPTHPYHVQIIFDGRDLTLKDYGLNDKSKTFIRTTLLPSGAKPGAAATLSGPIPFPLGIKPEDVTEQFEVTSLPSKDPNQSILQLIPRLKAHFDFTQLEVTIDKSQQLPIKFILSKPTGDVETITLQNIKTNTAAAKLANPSTPAAEGWTERQ